MGFSSYSAALRHYHGVQAAGDVEDASPYRLIGLLFEQAMERLQLAEAALARNDVAEKCRSIQRVIRILEALRQSLNHDSGGEMATNLDRLYQYVGLRLTEALQGGQRAKLREASEVLGEIRMAWEQIPRILGAHAVAANEPRRTM